jgi:hypothetical protein
MDDKAAIRYCLLRASIEDSLRLIQPRMWMALPSTGHVAEQLEVTAEMGTTLPPAGEFDDDGVFHPFEPGNAAEASSMTGNGSGGGVSEMEFVEVGVETIALQSDAILVLDHLTDIVIWSGSNVKVELNHFNPCIIPHFYFHTYEK